MTKREFFGEDLDQALSLASARLGIPSDELSFEQVPGRFSSLFGPTKVAIIVEYDEESLKGPVAESSADDLAILARMAEMKEDPKACSELVIRQILERMGLEVSQMKVSQEAEQIVLSIDLVGDPIDMRRGESREFRGALQYLINRIVHEGREGDQRFIIDFGGRLQDRAEAMRTLATRLAEKSLQTGKVLRVKLMDSQDRRLLHLGLVEDSRVKTFSEGEGRFRVLCIGPADAAPAKLAPEASGPVEPSPAEPAPA